MKIIKSRVHDIKLIGITAKFEESFIYLENRSHVDVKKKGIDHLFSTFVYSGMLDGFCVIVAIEIQHESEKGEMMEYRNKVGLDNQVKEFVRSFAKQAVFNVKE